MTTGKAIALTRQTLVGKVMSLFFNMLFRFVTAFIRSKCLFISLLQSLSILILEPKKIKSVTVSTFFPIYLSWSDRTRCYDISLFWMLSFKSALSVSCFTFKRLFSSTLLSVIQFSSLVMSDSLWPHEPQHARPPCPSPTPGVYPNSCPLRQWCHPTIASCVIPFSSCPQSFPALGSSQMSQLFTSGGQSIGVSASTSVLPMNTQDLSPLEWTGLIS